MGASTCSTCTGLARIWELLITLAIPHTPQMNGRVERFIKTLVYEFLNWQDDLIPELEQINHKCALFNHKYLCHRFHQALNYQTPAEYVTKHLEKGAAVLYV